MVELFILQKHMHCFTVIIKANLKNSIADDSN